MERMGRYALLRRLAAGGMAEVFLAQADGASQRCVVKRILPHLSSNEDFVTMLLNEGRLCAQLRHRNIVEFLDLGREGESYFLAMEYVDGPTLRGLVRAAAAAGRPLPPRVVVKIFSMALEGLGHAHGFVDGKGVPLKLVHRDISPDNLLLSRAGVAKVADFGIARAASIPSITKTGQVKGKLRYMSPEQLYDEQLDARSDLFATGVTFFEALTGKKPFDAVTEGEAIAAILNAPAPKLETLLGDVPRGLQEILDRALAKDRDQRYPDARSFQADLDALLAHTGPAVTEVEVAALIARLVPDDAARLSDPSSPTGQAPAARGDSARVPTDPHGPDPLAAHGADPETRVERVSALEARSGSNPGSRRVSQDTRIEPAAIPDIALPHGRDFNRATDKTAPLPKLEPGTSPLADAADATRVGRPPAATLSDVEAVSTQRDSPTPLSAPRAPRPPPQARFWRSRRVAISLVGLATLVAVGAGIRFAVLDRTPEVSVLPVPAVVDSGALSANPAPRASTVAALPGDDAVPTPTGDDSAAEPGRRPTRGGTATATPGGHRGIRSKLGKIVLRVAPPAEVDIDGQSVGTTSSFEAEFEPGRHVVHVRTTSGKMRAYAIELSANQTRRLDLHP